MPSQSDDECAPCHLAGSACCGVMKTRCRACKRLQARCHSDNSRFLSMLSHPCVRVRARKLERPGLSRSRHSASACRRLNPLSIRIIIVLGTICVKLLLPGRGQRRESRSLVALNTEWSTSSRSWCCLLLRHRLHTNHIHALVVGSRCIRGNDGRLLKIMLRVCSCADRA